MCVCVYLCSCVFVSLCQHKHRQQDLRDLRSLQECVRFLNHWKEQVAKVCKVRLHCVA